MYAGPIPAVGGPAAQGAAAPAGGGPSKHNDTLFDSILASALGADAERARLGDSGAGDARPSAGRGRGADDSAGDIAAASPELAAGAAEPPPVSVDEASSPAGTGGDPGEGPGARALDVGAWVVGGGPGVVEAGLAADGASLLGGAAEGAEEGASLNTRVSGDGDAGAWPAAPAAAGAASSAESSTWPGDRIPGVTDGAPHRGGGAEGAPLHEESQASAMGRVAGTDPGPGAASALSGPGGRGRAAMDSIHLSILQDSEADGAADGQGGALRGLQPSGSVEGEGRASGAAAGGPSPEAGFAHQADAAGAARLASAAIASRDSASASTSGEDEDLSEDPSAATARDLPPADAASARNAANPGHGPVAASGAGGHGAAAEHAPTAHLGDAGDAAHGVYVTDALGATGSAAGPAGGAEAAPSSGFGETIMSQLRPPVEDIVAELTRMPAADGRTEQVSIRLRPEFLGEVVMRISVDADGIVTARFIAEHAFVRSMIEQQLPELRAALAQHGLELGDASVAGGEAGLAWDDGPSPDHARHTGSRSPSFGPESTDEDAAEDHADTISSLTEGVIDIRV